MDGRPNRRNETVSLAKCGVGGVLKIWLILGEMRLNVSSFIRFFAVSLIVSYVSCSLKLLS